MLISAENDWSYGYLHAIWISVHINRSIRQFKNAYFMVWNWLCVHTLNDYTVGIVGFKNSYNQFMSNNKDLKRDSKDNN